MLTGNGAFCFTVAERLFVSFVIMLGGFVQARRLPPPRPVPPPAASPPPCAAKTNPP